MFISSSRITTRISSLLSGNFSRISGNLGLKTMLVAYLYRNSSLVPVVLCLRASNRLLGGFPRSKLRICRRNRKMPKRVTVTFAWTSARRARIRLSCLASTHLIASVSKGGWKITSSVRFVAQKLSPNQMPPIKTNLHSPRIFISTHMETKACPSHSSKDSCDLGNPTDFLRVANFGNISMKSNVELILNNWP